MYQTLFEQIKRGYIPDPQCFVDNKLTYDMFNYIREQGKLRTIPKHVLTSSIFAGCTNQQYRAVFRDDKPKIYEEEEIDASYGLFDSGINPKLKRHIADLDYQTFGKHIPHPALGLIIMPEHVHESRETSPYKHYFQTMTFRELSDWIKNKRKELRGRMNEFFTHSHSHSHSRKQHHEWIIVKNELWMLYEMQCHLKHCI
jgi:hypothetical protein